VRVWLFIRWFGTGFLERCAAALCKVDDINNILGGFSLLLLAAATVRLVGPVLWRAGMAWCCGLELLVREDGWVEL
jgi:hypothetical protein